MSEAFSTFFDSTLLHIVTIRNITETPKTRGFRGFIFLS